MSVDEIYRLELILGPMTAGKSTELRRQLKLKSLYRKVVAVTPKKDVRYGYTGIKTHDGLVFPSIVVENLEDLLSIDEYLNADVVGIDEGQFFTDIPEFIKTQLKETHKSFIISGLDGDKNKEFIGTLHKLIPEADKKSFLRALCKRCSNGTEAPFTIELIPFEGQEQIGGSELYEAVCRKHYTEIRKQHESKL